VGWNNIVADAPLIPAVAKRHAVGDREEREDRSKGERDGEGDVEKIEVIELST